MSEKSIVLLVHACDRYRFLYRGFERFFNLYWDKSADVELYFATEVESVQINGFVNLKSGKGEWSDRLRKLLSEDISSDYVLYMQEDMWLSSQVDGKFINGLAQFVRDFKPNLVKLNSAENYTTTPTENFISALRIAELVNDKSQFLMSHQPALWNRKFLIEQLGKGEHPWRNERRGTKRLRKLNPLIFHSDCFLENGHRPVNSNKPGAIHCTYYSVSVNGILNDRVLNFIPYLENLDNAEDKTYAAELRRHYENALTHDGLAKPRKQDVFNRIKRFFMSV